MAKRPFDDPSKRRVSDAEIVEAFEAIAGRYAGDWGAIKFIAEGMAKRLRRERLQEPQSDNGGALEATK